MRWPAELADSLRKDGASVSIQDGRWGREVVGTATGVVRFIGVDGYRWMIRCVVNSSAESIDALTEEAREALVDTVVRRGDTPLPVRTPLPVQLPEPMASQLRDAAAAQGASGEQVVAPPDPDVGGDIGGTLREKAHRRTRRRRPRAAVPPDRRCSSCAAPPAASSATMRG